MRKSFLIVFAVSLLVFSLNSEVSALGFATSGNKSLNSLNNKNWPGIMPVVNDKSRIYHTWVNGNEHFYYRGNNEALNNALKNFSESELKVREVVLRPHPGIINSFTKKKTIEFNWSLHIVGGVTKHMTTLDQGDKIWRNNPILTIYVGGDIQLDKIKIPIGVTVLELADLEERYIQALKSTDKTVRGWGSHQLASLNPYSNTNMNRIAKLLQDDDNWVRLNVCGALTIFGKKAESVQPALREALKTDDKQLHERIIKTLEKIKNAKENSKAEKEHNKMSMHISQFLQTMKVESKKTETKK